MTRNFWLLIHRWGGLVMAVPLIIVALTGSIIAFTQELNRLITPERFATVQPGVPQLDVDTLAARAQALVLPNETISGLNIKPDQVSIFVYRGIDGLEQKKMVKPSYVLYLDPWTGKELSRLLANNGVIQFEHPVMRFIRDLHYDLALGRSYMWVLGIIALMWTLDCFVSWYLTLPNSSKDFWRRWKPAWKIKARASTYRLNFDLHRANGLWLWPMLFVFAWSSVYFNLREVYDPVRRWCSILASSPARPGLAIGGDGSWRCR